MHLTASPCREQNPDSEAARKKAEADKLRAAEKFMVVGSGRATCKSCGYEYTPEKGDPDFPIPKGMNFEVGKGGAGGRKVIISGAFNCSCSRRRCPPSTCARFVGQGRTSLLRTSR